MGRRTQFKDAFFTHHFSIREESGLNSSWCCSIATTQDQIVSMAAMGDIRTDSDCERIISFGVAAWSNLTMVEVVLAPFCLDGN